MGAKSATRERMELKPTSPNQNVNWNNYQFHEAE